MLGYPWNIVTGQCRDELSVRLSRWLFLSLEGCVTINKYYLFGEL